MRRAVEVLFDSIEEKPTHGQREISRLLETIIRTSILFTSEASRKAFCDAAEAFAAYSEQEKKTGWEKNEFRQWWKTYCRVMSAPEMPLPLWLYEEGNLSKENIHAIDTARQEQSMYRIGAVEELKLVHRRLGQLIEMLECNNG